MNVNYQYLKLISSNYLTKIFSSFNKMRKRLCKANFNHYLKLYRINDPTCFWVIFISKFVSLSSASNSLLPKPSLIALLVLGSLAARSTGCVINDLADLRFDSKVV